MWNIFHIQIYLNKNHCILITEAVLTQNWTKCIYGGKGKKGFLWKPEKLELVLKKSQVQDLKVFKNLPVRLIEHLPDWSQGWRLFKGCSSVNCRITTADTWGAELGLNTICTQIYQDKCTLHWLPKNPWPTWLWSVMGKVYLVVWSPKKHYLLHCLNELHPWFFISSDAY